MFTIINNITGYLDILYGLESLIPSSGTGTRNCDMEKTANTKKQENSDLLKVCLK